MSWWQIIISSPAQDADRIELLMQSFGAAAVTLQDARLDEIESPIFEPEPGTTPLWPETMITGLFPLDSVPELIILVMSQTLNINESKMRFKRLDDKNWVRVWMQYFKPVSFTEKLWVIPEGFDPPVPDATNLFLDPGLAFGTGTHPTTSLCLEWLAQHLSNKETVLDYGCGSGILGIAAAALGAQKIWCVDIDTQALEATKKNAVKNSVADRIEICTPAELKLTEKPALIIANILANPLIELAPSFANFLTYNSILVISGIMSNQTESIQNFYGKWFDRFKINSKEDWMLIECRRK